MAIVHEHEIKVTQPVQEEEKKKVTFKEMSPRWYRKLYTKSGTVKKRISFEDAHEIGHSSSSCIVGDTLRMTSEAASCKDCRQFSSAFGMWGQLKNREDTYEEYKTGALIYQKAGIPIDEKLNLGKMIDAYVAHWNVKHV